MLLLPEGVPQGCAWTSFFLDSHLDEGPNTVTDFKMLPRIAKLALIHLGLLWEKIGLLAVLSSRDNFSSFSKYLSSLNFVHFQFRIENFEISRLLIHLFKHFYNFCKVYEVNKISQKRSFRVRNSRVSPLLKKKRKRKTANINFCQVRK